jgi:hypothetical protein
MSSAKQCFWQSETALLNKPLLVTLRICCCDASLRRMIVMCTLLMILTNDSLTPCALALPCRQKR